MADEKVKIFLVDDHRIFVKGVASLLEDEPGIAVAGLAFDGESALKFIAGNSVDLVLTDIQMQGMSGIELTKKIKDEYPGIKVIGLSMFDKVEIVKELVAAGADGYLLKDIEKSELLFAIREVMDGKLHYSTTVAAILMKSMENKDLLTKREKEIICMVATEHSNAMIADKLFISEHTVEAHRKNIFRKTKAKSIVGLVKYAYDNKLV